MSRHYVFADEAGTLEFARKPNVSKFFILCTVIMTDCTVGNALLTLRRELAWNRAPLGRYFHASGDKQEIRDVVFAVLARHDFTVQATILEKSKAFDNLRADESLAYQHAWYFHLRLGLARTIPRLSEALVSAAEYTTKKGQATFAAAVNMALRQTMARQTWRTDFPPAQVDPCIQVADYCAWAIQRRWEKSDDRSYGLIADRITYEHDLFKSGDRHFY